MMMKNIDDLSVEYNHGTKSYTVNGIVFKDYISAKGEVDKFYQEFQTDAPSVVS